MQVTARGIFGYTRRASRLALGVSALAVALSATPSQAQEDAAADEGAPIIVTGTRLQTTDGTLTPVPVTAVSTDDLEAMAPDTLITAVSQLPQFLNNETPNSGNFFTRGGYGNLNLRGLGINRTLTLLNNRRMPSSSAFGGVDINLFPQAMIQSVETVTGGASAQYGTDAVAGVVNFRINENFQGLSADAQYGVTDRDDNKNYKFTAAYGTDLGERLHVQVSGEYFKADGVHSFEGRDWYNAWGVIGAGTQASPYAFYPQVISANASFDGVISSPNALINRQAFNSAGNLSTFVLGTPNQNGTGAPPSRHSVANGGSGDDLASDLFTLYPDLERYSGYGFVDYDLSDDVRVYGQMMYGHTNAFSYNQPRSSFGGTPTALTIFSDNAFLPASLRQTMATNNIASFTFRRMGHSSDIGTSYLDDTTNQKIGTAGFEWNINNGGFMDGWDVNAYYQYGRTKRTWKQYGLRVDRIFAAVDAVDEGQFRTGTPNGNIVCRVSLFGNAYPGCQPLNLFGRGRASAAAVDYVMGNDVGEEIDTPLYFVDSAFTNGLTDSYTAEEAKVNLTTYKQHLAELNFAGDLMEGWAGPIKLAFGGSYRRENLFQIVRDSTNKSSNHDTFRPVSCNNAAIGLRGVSGPDCANTVGMQYSKVWNLQGGTEVKEAYAETLVPLIHSDILGANLSLAGRWADYSNSGSIWAYKVGLDIELTEMVRLRGNYSRDVRAPNLTERFDKTGGTATITDPAKGGSTVTITRFGGGNPNLDPEQADTVTLGIVVRPTDDLSLSVDWYNIKLKDAIAQAGNQEVVNRCEIGKIQLYCDLITRDAGGNITLLGDIFQNAGIDIVNGVDAELNYRVPVDVFGGQLSFRGFASWLIERSETREESAAFVKTDYANQTGYRQRDQILYNYPGFKLSAGLNYSNGGFSTFLQGRYLGSALQDACGAYRCTNNFTTFMTDNTVDSVIYVDVRVGYELDLGPATAEIFANVNNLFDRDPPLTPTYTPFNGYSTQHNANVYDVLGRRFTIGAKFTM